jgi:hypothetical protein
MPASRKNLLAMLGGSGITPESVRALADGLVPRLPVGSSGLLARAITIFEREKRARRDRRPFDFFDFLYAAVETLTGSVSAEVSRVAWIKTAAGFLWPNLRGAVLLTGELFAIKMAVVNSIWALNPAVLCDEDFSAWLGDDYFLWQSMQKAEIQVMELLAQAASRIPETPSASDEVLRLLSALKDAVLSRLQLEQATGFKRTFLMTHALDPALAAGWVETTEKTPSSPRQRYRLTETGRALLRDRSDF